MKLDWFRTDLDVGSAQVCLQLDRPEELQRLRELLKIDLDPEFKVYIYLTKAVTPVTDLAYYVDTYSHHPEDDRCQQVPITFGSPDQALDLLSGRDEHGEIPT